MFQLDDNFLQSVGLGGLPDDQKEAFLQHTYETLEERVGERLAADLSDEQLTEFESFATQDEEKVNAWLGSNAPDYRNEAEYKQMAESAPEDVTPLMLAAEYASVKWLGINSPNYRQVVAEELEKLRKEITASRDHIGGGQASPPSAAPAGLSDDNNQNAPQQSPQQ